MKSDCEGVVKEDAVRTAERERCCGGRYASGARQQAVCVTSSTLLIMTIGL